MDRDETTTGRPAVATRQADRRVRIRQAADAFLRRWDDIEQKVPAPALRILVAVPWLLRRAPVPFWVPVLLMVLRRLNRRRRSRRARRV